MYSRQQGAQVREEFWTVFGKYMQPVLSSEGSKVNWINYKTGARHIHFRMQAGEGAFIAIVLTHKKDGQRLQYFEKFIQLRPLFHNIVKEEWTWDPGWKKEDGKITSGIYTRLDGTNIYNRSDWPHLISFFKPRIIALDLFWNQVKPGFDVW